MLEKYQSLQHTPNPWDREPLSVIAWPVWLVVTGVGEWEMGLLHRLVLCPSSALGSCLQSMVGLRDGRPLWSLMACDPRVSQEISWAGWVGICLGWGSLAKRSPPKQFTEQLRFIQLSLLKPSGCQGRAWLYNLDPFSCLWEPSLKVEQKRGSTVGATQSGFFHLGEG